MNVTGDGADPSESRRHDQALRTAGRNGAVSAIGAVFASGAGFVLTLQVGHLLGTKHAGVLFSCIAIAMLLTTAAIAGADTGLVWALAREGATRSGAFQRHLICVAMVPVALISVAFAALLWWAAPGAAELLTASEPRLGVTLIRVMGVAIVAGALLQCLVQATRGMGDVRPFSAIQQFAVPGLRVVALAGAAALISSPGPSLVGVLWAAPLVVLLPAAAYLVHRRAAPRPHHDRPPRELKRTFWRYSLLRAVGATSALALVWIDVPLVAVLAGPSAAGAYAAASRFATSGQMSLQAMRLAVGPEIAAAFATEDTRRVQILYGVTTQWATLLSWPGFVLLFVFAHPVLGWFGPGFASASWALRILCLAMMVSVATGNVDTVLLMSGRSGGATANSLAALAAMLLVDVVAVPIWSSTGAALGWAIAILIDNGLGLWLVRARLGVSGHGRDFRIVAAVVTGIGLAGAAIALGVAGTTTPGLLIGAAGTGLGVGVFAYLRRRSLNIGLLFGRSG